MNMEFATFIGKDITIHTNDSKYRGVLMEVLIGVLAFKMGIDDFYIDASKVVAVTVHGMEST